MVACKKESVMHNTKMSSSKIGQLKAWYESNKSTNVGLYSRNEFTLYPQNVLWETGTYFPGSNKYVFSLSDYENGELSISKFLVIYLSEDGDAVNSEYIFMRTNETTTGMSISEIMTAYINVFEEEEIPLYLEVSIIKFNLEGERIFSKRIENGEITQTDEQIKSQERAPQEAGIEYCIDSWWVMYLEGQVIYIYYLGSECFCVGCNQNGGGGGSGNGNGGTATSSQCGQESFENILSNRKPISEPVSITLLQLSQTERRQMYTWNFFRVGDAFGNITFSSKEIGVQNKINGNWVWNSFNHLVTSKTTGFLPTVCWDATCNLQNSNAVISANPLFEGWASMELFYNINVSMSCLDFNADQSEDYTSGIVYNQNQTYIDL